MATLNNVFIVKESKTEEFLKIFKKPMLTEEFLKKCEKSARGINTNRK